MNECAESYTDYAVTVKHVLYYHVARKLLSFLRVLGTSNRIYNNISYLIDFSDYMPYNGWLRLFDYKTLF